MWFSNHMGLEAINSRGVCYGQVLAAGMGKAASLLNSKIPFDILFLKEAETEEEYETLVEVNEDATVDLIRN